MPLGAYWGAKSGGATRGAPHRQAAVNRGKTQGVIDDRMEHHRRLAEIPGAPPVMPGLDDALLEGGDIFFSSLFTGGSPWTALAIAAGESIVGGLIDLFHESDEEKLISMSLDELEVQRLRRAGVFSEEEIAEIRRGAEPGVNAVAGNVASRGLGSSAAGADIVRQAQQAPFLQAQAQAQQAYQMGLTNTFNMVQQYSQRNPSIQSQVGSLAKLYLTYQSEDDDPETEPLFNQFESIAAYFAEALGIKE